MAKAKTHRPTCPVCRNKYVIEREGQQVCNNIDCAMEHLKRKKLEPIMAIYRPKPKRLTPDQIALRKSDKKYVKKQVKAFLHRWIKWRDRGLPCIACNKSMANLTEWEKHASHYRSDGGHSALRYDEDNIHLGCESCNTKNSGNLTNYRINLVHKIGTDRVNRLESEEAKKVTRRTLQELEALRDDYKARLKTLKIKLPAIH